MPGNTKRRKRKKHRGTQTGSVERSGRRPRSRQEAMARARNQKGKGKGRAGPALKQPTWSGAAKRGVLFALLLFPVSLLFGQPAAGAALLTVIAAFFYVPLGYYTDRFFYQRRLAREQAAKLAKKQERGD